MHLQELSYHAELLAIGCSFIFVCCAFLGFGPGARVKSSVVSFGALLVIWLWTTTLWATHTKVLAGNAAFARATPSSDFWLTFAPQVMSCLFFVVLSWLQKSDSFEGVVSSTKDTFRFHVAGAAYFYGQLFTVAALARSSPNIVFVVKAVEPLCTALLAGPTLRKPFNAGLFMSIVIACTGIVLTALASSDIKHGMTMSQASCAGIVCAMLANIGFATRQCLVKSLYVHEGRGALETFGKVGLAGTAWGALPLLSLLTGYPNHKSMTLDQISAGLSTAMVGEWLIVSVCYFLYQGSSLLILQCIAVESHALLVGMKHVFSVITVSLLLGNYLSPSILFGLSVSAAGLWMYSAQGADELQKTGSTSMSGIFAGSSTTDADPETPLLKPALGSNHGIPPVLYCISGILVLLGCTMPILF